MFKRKLKQELEEANQTILGLRHRVKALEQRFELVTVCLTKRLGAPQEITQLELDDIHHKQERWQQTTVGGGGRQIWYIDVLDASRKSILTGTPVKSTVPTQNGRQRYGTEPELLEAYGEKKSFVDWAKDPRCDVKEIALRKRYKKYGSMEAALEVRSDQPPGRSSVRVVDGDTARSIYVACHTYSKKRITYKEVAGRFGVSIHVVRRIAIRETYREDTEVLYQRYKGLGQVV